MITTGPPGSTIRIYIITIVIIIIVIIINIYLHIYGVIQKSWSFIYRWKVETKTSTKAPIDISPQINRSILVSAIHQFKIACTYS